MKDQKSEQKKFNKIEALQMVGLLTKKFNYDTHEFEDSRKLTIICFVNIFLRVTYAFKHTLFYLFPREATAQLFIGSLFNYLHPNGRMFMAIVNAIVISWVLTQHLAFNYFNEKNNCRLFYRWMQVTDEIPAGKGKPYKVIGLSADQNTKFWQSEDRINALWFKSINGNLVGTVALFCLQMFIVKFDVDLWLYLLMQTIHIAHNAFFLVTFLHSVYTFSLFHITVIKFYSKKFQYISEQVERFNAASIEKANNRKLAKLISDYNHVQLEMMEINSFFKRFFGANLIHAFIIMMLVIFVSLECNWNMKMAFRSCMLIMFLAIILTPSVLANNVITQVKRVRRAFENAAFLRSSSLKNRQRIYLIGIVSRKASFTCFDWFSLSSETCLHLTCEIIINILLLVQTYYIYQIGT